MRRYFWLPIVAVLIVACQEAMAPGDRLSGKWLNPDARLIAGTSGTEFQGRCVRATFGPVTVDSGETFHASSITLDQGGNLNPTPGTYLEIRGSIVPDGLRLLLFYHVPKMPTPDPIGMTLAPGSATDPLVCNQ